MATGGDDRRLHPRVSLLAQVRVKRGETDLVMELANISLGGALLDMGSLELPPWLDIGAVVTTGIVHPVDLDVVDIDGRVVRIERDEEGTRFAVRFSNDDAAVTAALARLISATRDPDGARDKPRPPPLPKA